MNENPESRSNGCTPKRRLSFVGHVVNNSPSEVKKNAGKKVIESPQIDTNQSLKQDENEESPFIKRKCLNKEQSYFKYTRTGSPCCVSSCDLVELYTLSESPKLLNESFETLKLTNKDENGRNFQTRNMGRRASYQAGFTKHKSAPLTSLNLNKIMNSSDFNPGRRQSLVNTGKQVQNFDNISLTNNEDDEDRSRDHLENLIFGNENEPPCIMIDTSDHQQLIKHSLEIDATCVNLIGDRSKEHILPVISSAKHQDLYCISPETLVDVLNGNFDDRIDEFIIIDSRYPYEYEGGHIHNALNIFTKDRLFEEMFIKRLNLKKNPSNVSIPSKFMSTSKSIDLLSDSTSSDTTRDDSQSEIFGRNQSFSSGYLSDFQKELNDLSSDKDDLYTVQIDRKADNINIKNKRVIVIFHCEFSSERGPSLLRFLRNQDRALNEDVYPYLHYPELYLLEGGYKSFYENFKSYCDPQTYKPMLHAEHLNDLKHFRAKAKSWEVSNNLQYLQKKRPSVVRFKSDQK